MNTLLRWLTRQLLGPAAVDGITDSLMDGLTRAMDEEFARLTCAHVYVPASANRTYSGPSVVRCEKNCGSVLYDALPSPRCG